MPQKMLVPQRRIIPQRNLINYKRKHYRMSAQFPVEFKVVRYLGELIPHLNDKQGSAVAHDLAESGLAFVSGLRLPVDMVIQISFDLPGVGVFKELANVVRSRPMGQCYLTGVKFLKIDDMRRSKLREYISGEVRKSVKLIPYL